MALPEAAKRSRASKSGKSASALEPQLASMSGSDNAALDATSVEEDAARSNDEGVALCLRTQSAEGTLEA